MSELTVFAKKRISRDGKPFYTYLTRLTRRDGTQITTQVKFKQSCNSPKPEQCPLNIVVERHDVNLATKRVTNEDTGEIIESKTLWISSYERGSEYVDNSMDEYDI